MEVSPFRINYIPHGGQMEVLSGIAKNPQANVITVDAARGWGKTLWVVNSIVIPHLLHSPMAQVMWVAPTYKICKSPVDDVFFGYDELTSERFVPQFCEETSFKYWEYFKADNEIHMFNDTKVFFRSADNPDSIVSKGYSLIIIDEAALIAEDVFNKQILATARRQNCKIILISTPRGKNWFYYKYLDGQDLNKKSYISFKQPWWKRPDYPKLLVNLMQDLPEHIRKQEFDAEFIDNSGGTFRNLESIFAGKQIDFESDQQEWKDIPDSSEIESSQYVLSADLAKSKDYTVLSVLNTNTRKLHYYRRYNKTDYKIVVKDIERVSKMFDSCDVIFDATGIGASLADFLTVNAYPYKFTNESKNDLINRLILSCDYDNIRIPNIRTIRQEFELFEYKITRTGKISYSAPAGRHDDCVISIAMANWYADEYGGSGEINSIDNFLGVMGGQAPKDFFDFMDNDND